MRVLVDVMSGYDDNNPDGWQNAVDAAVPRLLEVGVIQVGVEGTDDDVQVNIEAGPLFGGSAVVLRRLVHELAAARGQDPDDVIVELREWIDTDLDGSSAES